MSDESILATANITAAEYAFYNVACQDASWLAQGYPELKGYDIVVIMAEFFSQVANASLAITPFAALIGTTEERVQLTFNSYTQWFGVDFATAIIGARDAVPAFGHPVVDSGLYVSIYTILTALVVICLGLRFYSRITIGGVIQAYDWILIVASVGTMSFGLMNGIALSGPTHYRGYWDRTWKDYAVNQKIGIATPVLYPSCVFLIKTSLLLFYYKLTSWLPLRAATIVIFLVVLGNCVAMIYLDISKCVPAIQLADDSYWTAVCKTDLWQKSEPITGSINIATDIALWAIPLPMVWKITQNFRERIFAIFTFGTGALACIACGLRFSSAKALLDNSSLGVPDQSKWLLWSIVELEVAICCSCVPSIRALLIKKLPSIIGSTGFSREVISYDESQGQNKDKSNIYVHAVSSPDTNDAYSAA